MLEHGVGVVTYFYRSKERGLSLGLGIYHEVPPGGSRHCIFKTSKPKETTQLGEMSQLDKSATADKSSQLDKQITGSLKGSRLLDSLPRNSQSNSVYIMGKLGRPWVAGLTVGGKVIGVWFFDNFLLVGPAG